MENFSKTKPKFKHDCPDCMFLGRHMGTDLYYCPQAGNGTIIVRYSSEPSDNSSGIVFGQMAVTNGEFNRPIAQAYMRAKALNLTL